MSEDTSAISRRKMITGLGVSAGAIAASGLALPTVAGAAPRQDLVPEAIFTTPGLTYIALSAWDLRPQGGGPVASGTYGVYSSEFLVAQLQVPQGAVLKEIDAWGVAAVITIYRAPHDSRSLVQVSQLSLPSGAGMQTVHQSIADTFVDLANNTYLVSVKTNNINEINAVRVGYRPASAMTPNTPIDRVFDTRSGARLAAGSDTVVPLRLPAFARAAVLTLTVTQTTGTSGYVGVYPADAPGWPGNSNINWFGPDQNLATGVTTPISSFGAIILHVGENATHAIVDVQGYLT